MEKMKAIPAAIAGLDPRKKALLCAGVVLIVALLVSLCISINMRANMQKQYALVSNQIGEALYTNLTMLRQTFDMTAVPTADVQNAIIPQMREYFIASTTLNDLLTRCYGARYAVLSENDVSALRKAFDAYDQAFQNNTSTDLAQADMQRCMGTVRELLYSRFSGMSLKPSR